MDYMIAKFEDNMERNYKRKLKTQMKQKQFVKKNEIVLNKKGVLLMETHYNPYRKP